jgi:hypothetical protein
MYINNLDGTKIADVKPTTNAITAIAFFIGPFSAFIALMPPLYNTAKIMTKNANFSQTENACVPDKLKKMNRICWVILSKIRASTTRDVRANTSNERIDTLLNLFIIHPLSYFSNNRNI